MHRLTVKKADANFEFGYYFFTFHLNCCKNITPRPSSIGVKLRKRHKACHSEETDPKLCCLAGNHWPTKNLSFLLISFLFAIFQVNFDRVIPENLRSPWLYRHAVKYFLQNLCRCASRSLRMTGKRLLPNPDVRKIKAQSLTPMGLRRNDETKLLRSITPFKNTQLSMESCKMQYYFFLNRPLAGGISIFMDLILR
jgi:hypothetical protein